MSPVSRSIWPQGETRPRALLSGHGGDPGGCRHLASRRRRADIGQAGKRLAGFISWPSMMAGGVSPPPRRFEFIRFPMSRADRVPPSRLPPLSAPKKRDSAMIGQTRSQSPRPPAGWSPRFLKVYPVPGEIGTLVAEPTASAGRQHGPRPRLDLSMAARSVRKAISILIAGVTALPGPRSSAFAPRQSRSPA